MTLNFTPAETETPAAPEKLSETLLRIDNNSDDRSFLGLPKKAAQSKKALMLNEIDQFRDELSFLVQRITAYYPEGASSGLATRDTLASDSVLYIDAILSVLSRAKEQLTPNEALSLRQSADLIHALAAEWEKDDAATTRDIEQIAQSLMETLSTITAGFDSKGNRKTGIMSIIRRLVA